MLISVIVNNYNYQFYLQNCIDSCLNQQHYDLDHDLELIVVDDGSTDDSRSVILGYGFRITSVFKANGGQGSALNAGFRMSNGDIVVFLDADDILAPHCLATLSKNWDSSFSKIHFNLEMIGENGELLGYPYCREPLPRGDLKRSILKHGNCLSMPTSGNAFSRSFLNEVMPMPEADWRRSADVYLVNLAVLAGRVGAIDIPLGYYRTHDKNGSSHVINGRFRFDKCYTSIVRELKTDEIIYNYSKKHGMAYNKGALTDSYDHLQLVLVHDKLAILYDKSRFGSPFRTFAKMLLNSWSLLREVAVLKMVKLVLINLWMFLILAAPPKLA
jgi:glycosyltransferase involved in cell wall biosynthesis